MSDQQTPTPRPRDPGDVDPSRDLWSLWRGGQQPRVADFLQQAGVRDLEQVVMALRVDQAERCRMGQWVSAEDYLDAFPAVREHAESTVDLIFAEYLLREERGERPPLEEFLRRFPEHAADLTLQIELHQALKDGGQPDANGSGSAATLPVGISTEPGARTTAYPEIPGYHVQGLLGEGGMGVVYRAWQVALKRWVAVKMLHAGALASPEMLARFRIEAEAVARLRHPNIVRIHGVGEHAGAPYLVLELVEGRSLAQTLAGTPQAAEWAAGTMEALARAIHSAHLQSVVHRDLSPANVLMATDGSPKITDFGLAKLVIGGGSLRTATGDLLGTPSYMAPEQAGSFNSKIGPATDVYALGAILYEMLTGRPPFKAEQPMETMRQVLADEPVAPSRLRPRLPRDLETICLKCLQKEPSRRYATAEALADELRRFLERRPIRTRRSSPAERAWRWCRRNPWPAVAATLMTILAVGAIVSAGALRHQLDEVRKANRALRESYRREQDRYNLAVDAIRSFHTGVSHDFLLEQDQFKELRDRLLKSASDFYAKLGTLMGRASDPASRRALADANFEVAELTAKVGRKEDALAAHRTVLAARALLASEPGAVEEARAAVGRSLIAIGSLLEQTGKTDEAVQVYRQAETLLAGLAGRTPAAAAVRGALADCRSRLGVLLKNTGHAADALTMFRRARADQEELAGAVGATAEVRNDLATTINRIALLMTQTGRSAAEGESEHRAAPAIRRRLADEYPAIAEFRDGQAAIHNNLGLLLSATGRPAAAETEYRAALAIRRKLAKDHPAVTNFRTGQANIHNHLGLLLWTTGRPAVAEAEFRAALAICQELADDHPGVMSLSSLLANSHNNLGNLLSSTGRLAAAEAEFRAAMAIRQKLADDHPTIAEYRSRLATNHQYLGNVLWAAGRPAAAEAEFRRALVISQEVVDKQPAVASFRFSLAEHHIGLGIVLSAAGKPAAEAEFRAAMALDQELADGHPTATECRSRLAFAHSNLGLLQSATGRSAAAEAEFRAAMALLQKLVDDNPAVPSYRRELADVTANLAAVLLVLGRDAEARATAGRAVALHEALLDQAPRPDEQRGGLGRALLRRGQARLAGADPVGATADWRRAVAVFQAMPAPEAEADFLEACCHAMLAGAATADGPEVSAGDGPSEADRAMDALRRAVTMGYRSADHYRTESALAPLRARDDFRLMMMDLDMPDDPFAPGR